MRRKPHSNRFKRLRAWLRDTAKIEWNDREYIPRLPALGRFFVKLYEDGTPTGIVLYERPPQVRVMGGRAAYKALKRTHAALTA